MSRHRVLGPSVRWALRFGWVIAAATGASQAQAVVRFEPPQDIQLSYAVTTPYAIDNIITFNSYADGGIGSWWPSSVASGGSTISDPFAKSSWNAPLSALVLGLVSNLPNDAVGQTHVVLMMDPAAATASQGLTWGTLFGGTGEAQLAAAIGFVTGTTRDPDGTGNSAQWDAEMNTLSGFASGDARTGLTVPAGTPVSAWFSLGPVVPGQTTTTSFSVMAFSDGLQIGTGTASLTTAVPEPANWALLAAGLVVVGAGSRRRRP